MRFLSESLAPGQKPSRCLPLAVTHTLVPPPVESAVGPPPPPPGNSLRLPAPFINSVLKELPMLRKEGN